MKIEKEAKHILVTVSSKEKNKNIKTKKNTQTNRKTNILRVHSTHTQRRCLKLFFVFFFIPLFVCFVSFCSMSGVQFGRRQLARPIKIKRTQMHFIQKINKLELFSVLTSSGSTTSQFCQCKFHTHTHIMVVVVLLLQIKYLQLQYCCHMYWTSFQLANRATFVLII